MNDYFHVVTQYLNNSEQVLFRDLSKKELKKLFLKPFKNGKNLLISGSIYKNEDIKKVQIIKTEDHFQKTLDNYYEDQQNESKTRSNNEQYGGGLVFFPPYISKDTDIIDCGGIEEAAQWEVRTDSHRAVPSVGSFSRQVGI